MFRCHPPPTTPLPSCHQQAHVPGKYTTNAAQPKKFPPPLSLNAFPLYPIFQSRVWALLCLTRFLLLRRPPLADTTEVLKSAGALGAIIAPHPAVAAYRETIRQLDLD